MNKKILRIISFILVLIMGLANLPFTFAEEVSAEKYDFSYYEVNPILDGLDIPRTVYADVYSSVNNEDFNPDEYLTDADAAAVSLRSSLESRTGKFTVKYISDQELTEADIEALLEAALFETDAPTQGDYLRWTWRTRSVEGNYVLYGDDYYNALDIEYTYLTTAAQEQEMDVAVDNLVDSFAFTSATAQQEKIDKIYDYITDNVVYDYENLGREDYLLQHTAYAALLQGKAVCQGYAVLFYRLAEECGLDARVITGVGGTGRDSNHAWNIVGLGDYYYYLDSTWDAERTSTQYQYYLKGYSDFPGHLDDPMYCTPEFHQRYPIPESGVSSSEYVGPRYEGDYEYYYNSTNVVIAGYNGNGGDVTVPATINNLPVVTVDSGTFYQNSNVENLTFSEGIVSLAPGAVNCCYALKSVHFPSTMNLRNYGSYSATDVPIDCDILEEITVAQGNPYIKVVDGILYDIDMRTLLLCPALYPEKELVIPEGVVDIGNEAVSNCQNIEKVTMPDSVEHIWYWAFTTSVNLKEINISKSCETIGQFAFMNTKIQSLNIPASLTNIMDNAFGIDVSHLESITVDKDNPIYRMINGALYDETTLIKYPSKMAGEEFTLPEGIDKISTGALYDAKNLKKITLTEDLKTIDNSAFYGCSALEHMEIPESVTTLGEGIFVGCGMMVSIIIPETIDEIDTDLCHPSDTLTVYGVSGSAAHAYANAHPGFIFKEIGTFACADGHQFEPATEWETEFSRAYRHKCKVCQGTTIVYYEEIADDIDQAEVVLEYTEIEYTGEVLKPDVLSVTFEGTPLVENVDYILSYFSDGTYTGNHSIQLEGIGKFAGVKIVQYYVKPKKLQNVEIKGMQWFYPYTGENQKPIEGGFTVYADGVEVSWLDLYCTYEDECREPGKYVFYVKGTNNYEGAVEIPYYIYPSNVGANDIGGDRNLGVSGGVSTEEGLIEVELYGAPTYTLYTFSPNGDVAVYADKNGTIPVEEGTEITPDSGVTKLYAVAKDADGFPIEYTIEIISPQVMEYTDTLAPWAAPYIESLNNTGLGLIKGVDGGKFNGGGQLTRYQMAALLLRLQGTNSALFAESDLPFSDNLAPWASNYVKASYTVGLIGGIPVPGTDRIEFKGTNVATRNQFFRLLMNVVVGDVDTYYLSNKAEIDAYVEAQGFTDLNQVGEWAKPGTYTAIYLGFVEGAGGKINPNGTISRNAAAVLLAKYLENQA